MKTPDDQDINASQNQPPKTPDDLDINADQEVSAPTPMPEVHRGTDGHTYAVVEGRSIRIDSQEFRRIARFELLAVGDELPSPDQVRAYLDQLMARAHRRPPEQAHLRVFQRESRILVDLANGAGEVVEIDVTGCRVTRQSEVRFLRPGGTEAMVTPVFGGDYRRLRRFIRLPDPAFLLFVAHLTYQFCDGAPQPIMVLAGEQGRSKTTVAKMVQMLTDPREPAVRQLPPSSRDLMVAARHSRVLNFDNVSVIKQALSDTLCSLSTGGGYGIRTGHTDTEETRFDARRPIVLGGIGNFVVRDDLRDRCVFYELEPIAESQRVAEGPLWQDFKASLPTILGGLFSMCSRALGVIGSIKPAKLYRMADFYLWALAIEQVAGWPAGSIDAAYGDQRAASDVEAMEADLVVAITRLLSNDGHWSGTASSLVETLKAIPGLASGALPRTASKLGGELQRIAPLLRRNSIDVENQRTGASRKIILTLQGVLPPSLVSPPSQGSSATLPATQQASPATEATPQIPTKPASDGGDGGDGNPVPVKGSVIEGPKNQAAEVDDDSVVTTPAERGVEQDLDAESAEVSEDKAQATNGEEQDDDDGSEGDDGDGSGSEHISAADAASEAEVAQVRPPSIRPIYRVLKGRQLSAPEVLAELQRLQIDGGKSSRRVRKLLVLGTDQGVFQRVGRGNYTC